MFSSAFIVAVMVALLICASALAGWAETDEPSAAPASRSGQFRAGAATSNITPRLGISINGYFNDRVARHIHDELHARCLVLDDGRTRLAIVVCDSCMIPRELADAAMNPLQNIQRLEAGDDNGHTILRRERRIFCVAHDGADVTGGEKPLHAAVRR